MGLQRQFFLAVSLGPRSSFSRSRLGTRWANLFRSRCPTPLTFHYFPPGLERSFFCGPPPTLPTRLECFHGRPLLLIRCFWGPLLHNVTSQRSNSFSVKTRLCRLLPLLLLPFSVLVDDFSRRANSVPSATVSVPRPFPVGLWRCRATPTYQSLELAVHFVLSTSEGPLIFTVDAPTRVPPPPVVSILQEPPRNRAQY